MRSKAIVMIGCVSATAVLLAGMPARMSAQESQQGNPGQGDQLLYEFVGQVQNFAPAGPGLPATSIQYGYLSHVEGLSDSQIYLPGVASERGVGVVDVLQRFGDGESHYPRQLEDRHS